MQIAGCSFWLERLQQRMTDFGHSRYFTKLVGAALATFMLATPASARQWVMEGAAPVKTLHAAQTGPLPTRCVVGNGVKQQSSLSL